LARSDADLAPDSNYPGLYLWDYGIHNISFHGAPNSPADGLQTFEIHTATPVEGQPGVYDPLTTDDLTTRYLPEIVSDWGTTAFMDDPWTYSPLVPVLSPSGTANFGFTTSPRELQGTVACPVDDERCGDAYPCTRASAPSGYTPMRPQSGPRLRSAARTPAGTAGGARAQLKPRSYLGSYDCDWERLITGSNVAPGVPVPE
jgi:hypothetical protein